MRLTLLTVVGKGRGLSTNKYPNLSKSTSDDGIVVDLKGAVRRRSGSYPFTNREQGRQNRDQ